MAIVTTMNSSEAERRFIFWEDRSRDTIDVKRCYLKMTGDLPSGILLSQIIYWFLPTKSGESRLRVERQGRRWLAKARADWEKECFLSPKQFDRAIGILRDLGVVQTALFRFYNAPTTHITVCWDVLESRLAIPAVADKRVEKPILPKGENRDAPTLDFDQRVNSSFPKGQIPLITETTAETKSKYKTPLPPQAGERVGNRRERDALDPAIENAVDIVMGGCNFAGRRGIRFAVRDALQAYALEKSNDPADVAAMMVEAWREFMEEYKWLKFAPGPKNFFRDGYWRNKQGWRYDDEKLKLLRRIG